MTIGSINEFKRAEEQRLAKAANKADAIIGGTCLVLCLAYVVAKWAGWLA